ncbi:M23 family metallopeptidase [Helicobacter bilis]|uniref:M23 family metallopeptidase n=1 Tax=Helicobacter bilis TaxID=37372 RepID=UPI0009856213|nr:M23 family metallopeptidase [Helicobacter bilis]
MVKTQQLKVKVYLEDAFTPVNGVKITLIPLHVKDSTTPKNEQQEQISKNGEAIFTLPNNANKFRFEVFDERFYKEAKSNMERTTNSYNDTNNTISLNLLSKPSLYFNGKELYINNGNKVIDYFRAYSGNALSIKEKESLKEQYGYENFVSYKEKENAISYFCLDKGWQKEKDKGAIPEGIYYIDINKSTDNTQSGIRTYNNTWYSLSRTKEGEKQWGKYNIPIYTDKDCTNTLESTTQRDSFYLHGGDKYGNAGGIDLAKEIDSFVASLQRFSNQAKDDKLSIKLLVEYAHILSSTDLQSVDLHREIQIQIANNTPTIKKHRVALTANYTKPDSMSEESFKAQKQQTYWGYKEIAQTEEYNLEEVRIKDITLFQKRQKDYKGKNIEINLKDYDWQHCNKQIIVFAFLDTDRNINAKGEEVLKKPKWRIITWHNPIVNPRVTLFSFSGNSDRIETAMFGYFTKRGSKKHQGIDLFAKIGTKLYAPLDCEVVSIGNSSSYGYTITLKVTESSLEILKIRRAFINYQLQYVTYNNNGSVNEKNSEIEQEKFNKEAKSYYLFYAHLSEVHVKKGDKVVAGQILGLSGTSGNAKGTKAPHLHFEIRDTDNVEKGLTNRINPAYYIECKKLYSEFSEDEKQEQLGVCKTTCKLPKE